ncbi:TldD/PmbA family protein [Candidatus Bathyarchaeota archaeon]|nr:TldD/PmbA family protein [Candidatus Bathyarchaeota archaeon]
MFDLCENALGHLKGVDYADVRVESYDNTMITVMDGQVQKCLRYYKKGAAIRVLTKGAWGFQSTTDLTDKGLKRAADAAVSMANAESIRLKEPVEIAPIKVCEDEVIPYVKIDFREMAIDDLIGLCLQWNKAIKVNEGVARAITKYGTINADKYFASSEGARIRFVKPVPFLGLTAFGKGSGGVQSYSDDVGGTGGHEIFAGGDPIPVCEKVGLEAVALAEARTAPQMRDTHVIFDPDFMSLLTHEIVGHPSEGDRVAGREAAWAGTAWWKGMEGETVGSEYFTAYDDPTVEGTYGHYLYDDEGTPARRKVLVEKGVIKERMHSRETAAMFGVEPNSGMRANTYEYYPIIRMSNSFWGTGDWKPEEIIEDTKEGILLVGARSPSIDDARYQWAISSQQGWLVKNGELAERVKNCLVTATSPVFFKSIDALADDTRMGTADCGKGDPLQLAAVGNGGPHMRGVATILGG